MAESYRILNLAFSYYLVCCIDIITKTAVDCFAIISGFVMYGQNIKYRKIVSLWLPAFTYSVIYFTVVSIIKHSFSLGTMLNSVFPVLSSKWWYLTAYVGAFFLFPFVNKLIESLSDKGAKKLLFVLFAVFSLSQFIPALAVKTYYFVGGYNVVWLLVLYFGGGIIKRLDLATAIKKRTALIFIMASLAIICLWKIVFEELGLSLLNGFINSDLLSSYTSPAIVIFAFFTVILFAKLDFRKSYTQKSIKFLSSSAFSVYLIQELVYKDNMFVFVAKQNVIIMILLIIGIPIAVFMVCTFIEHIRSFVFSLLKIEQNISSLIDKVAKRIIN